MKHTLHATLFLALLLPHAAYTDLVQATYQITADGFLNSNSQPPPPPTSTSVSGTYTFTFDTALLVQKEITPNVVSGLDIVANNDQTIDFNESNSGINISLLPVQHLGFVIIGGSEGGVEFMFGGSNDFRLRFDISLTDFTVNSITEDFSFVTEADPFYLASSTSVELLSAHVIADTDLDGVVDDSDNCVLVANPDQRDTNADGIGNICDPDFNQDCQVNFPDLNTMKANFFAAGDLDTDLNGDNNTNFGDLTILKSYFFGPPGPGLPGSCP